MSKAQVIAVAGRSRTLTAGRVGDAKETLIIGARGRTQTGKALRPRDFKSLVFTSFTTRARR